MTLSTWSFFTPGSNPLLDYSHQLVSGLGFSRLALGAVILAVCLGYCAYTDIFRGMVIPNAVNLGLWLGGLAASPLIYRDVKTHLIAVGVVTLVVVVMYLGRFFAEGDLKLYAALATLLGWGAFALMLISWFIIVVYSLPALVAKQRARRAGTAKGMTKVPAGPGIALAFPATLWLANVKPGYCIELALIEVGTCIAALLLAALNRRADALERAQAAAELEKATHPFNVAAEDRELRRSSATPAKTPVLACGATDDPAVITAKREDADDEPAPSSAYETEAETEASNASAGAVAPEL